MAAPLAVRIPFESREISIPLPRRWRLLGEHRPRSVPPLTDLAASLREALERPIGCAPLTAADVTGKKIVLAVDDISRPTPTRLFFPHVLERLLALGAKRDDLLVVHALGVHRPMTDAEVDEKLGKGTHDGVRWENHDAFKPDAVVRLGTTSRGTEVLLNRRLVEADLIVCFGAVEPHLLLGFGGGLKMIVPGLANQTTIGQNHMQGVTPDHFNYVGAETSPMRLDLEEAAGMLKKRIFAVNVVMNEKLEPCRFVCGDPVAAHREGVRAVRDLGAQTIDEPADVAIVASSPMNADLRQGMKCVGNIQRSVKEGGLIVALLECRHGIGDLRVPPRMLPHEVLRTLLRVLGKRRILGFVDRVQARDGGAGVEERFLAHFTMQTVRRNELFLWSPKLPKDAGKRLGLFRQFADVGAMMARAERVAPRTATVRVWPHGGMTYAP